MLTRCLFLLLSISFFGACAKQELEEQFQPKLPYLVAIPTEGVSMQGVLPDGELRLMDFAFPFSKLQAGDIVMFWDYKRNMYVLHLIVGKQGGAWITRGSNPVTNKVADPTFLMQENYMAKYIGERLDK